MIEMESELPIDASPDAAGSPVRRELRPSEAQVSGTAVAVRARVALLGRFISVVRPTWTALGSPRRDCLIDAQQDD